MKDEAISMHMLLNLPELLGIAEPYIDTNIDRQTLQPIGKGLLPGSSDLEMLRISIADSFVGGAVVVG